MQSYLFLLLLPLVLSTDPQSFEKIYATNLPYSPDKTLLIYRFEALEDYPSEQFTSVNIIAPALVREFMVTSGADKLVEVSLSNGRLSPLEKRTRFEDWNLPFDGLSVKAQTSATLDWQGVLLQVSELVGVSVTPLINSNSFGNSTYFGNLRYEFFSPENLIKIRSLLPCSGNKGAFSLFHTYNVFAADYSGLHFSLQKTESGQVKMQVDMAFLVDSKRRKGFWAYLNRGAISFCPAVNSSKIEVEGFPERTLVSFGQVLASEVVEELTIEKTKGNSTDKGLQKSKMEKPSLRQARWVTSPSVQWEGVLVHAILNQSPNDLLCTVYTYMPYEAYPIQSGMETQPKYVFKLDTRVTRVGENQDHLIRNVLIIKAGQEIKLKIPFKKLLRQFETYSHDPQRGKDFPAMPIQCQIAQNAFGKGEVIVDELSPSVLVYFPEPDYSMPFNVLTIGMGVIGYLTITMFRLSF